MRSYPLHIISAAENSGLCNGGDGTLRIKGRTRKPKHLAAVQAWARIGRIMTNKLYALVRHNGQWGISARTAPFLSRASYQEALDVATQSAAILRSAYWGRG
jgi:hypothetical protein